MANSAHARRPFVEDRVELSREQKGEKLPGFSADYHYIGQVTDVVVADMVLEVQEHKPYSSYS